MRSLRSQAVSRSRAGCLVLSLSLACATIGLGGQTLDPHRVRIAPASGFTDVSPKQLARTSDNTVYIVATNCDAYPCTASAQTVRVWKGDVAGTPGPFARKDAPHEHPDAGSPAVDIPGPNIPNIFWQG